MAIGYEVTGSDKYYHLLHPFEGDGAVLTVTCSDETGKDDIDGSSSITVTSRYWYVCYHMSNIIV